METKNKLITIFDTNINDLNQINIVNELIGTIYNLDNFLFRTLLLYILEANMREANIENNSQNTLTLIDEQNENEYLIEIKDGFFCISILNNQNEEYIGEMITFQCSQPNDIFVSIIDEDILELNGNENAITKRKIIIEKMLKPLLIGLTHHIKNTIYTELQLDIFTKLLVSKNILQIVSSQNFEIIKNANPEIISIIWDKLFGNYLKTENSLEAVINKHYNSNKNIIKIMNEIYNNVVFDIIISHGGYTYVSKNYPNIILCYEELNNIFKTTRVPLSYNLKSKYYLMDEAVDIDLYDDIFFIKNRNLFYSFIKEYLDKKYLNFSHYIKDIIISNITNLIYNNNIQERYKEDFLTELFNIEAIYKNIDILETISEYKFKYESKNIEIERLIKLLERNKSINLKKSSIFIELSELDTNSISIREAYNIISKTRNKDVFNMILNGIINNDNINIHDKILFYKEILENQSIVNNLLDINSFNLIFNQNIYEVNHYTSTLRTFLILYGNVADPKFLVNFSNYYEYEFCNQMLFIEPLFKNIIKKSKSEQLIYLLENSKFIAHNNKLLRCISKHKNNNAKIKKMLKIISESTINTDNQSLENAILAKPISINSEIFDVIKNTKSPIFIHLLMSKFNDNLHKFNYNDIKYFIENFIVNVNVEPAFLFSESILSNNEVKILSHIQHLFNNISVIIEKDIFYDCEEDLCFVTTTDKDSIAMSKKEFDYFANCIDSCFNGSSYVYNIMQELSLEYDSISYEDEKFCQDYLFKIAYQKIKSVAESPIVYSELLDYMINTSWFVRDKLDILELILKNPMCTENTKDLIINDVLKKKEVSFEELINISDEDMLMNVIQNCKITQKTLVKFAKSEHSFKHSKKINKAIADKFEIKRTNTVLNKISKQELESLNYALSKFPDKAKSIL